MTGYTLIETQKLLINTDGLADIYPFYAIAELLKLKYGDDNIKINISEKDHAYNIDVYRRI